MPELKIEHWPLSRLLPYARNPRKNDHAVEQMAAVITEFGFRIPLVAKSNGELIDGHLRLKGAQRLGLETVPVALADELTDAQIKAFRLLANRSAAWAEWDNELLGLELAELQDGGFDLGLTGFSSDEWDALINGGEPENAGQTDEDDAPGVAATPVSVSGDVWILGNHRLLCGDATAPVRTGSLASAIDTIETHSNDAASATVQIDDSAQGLHEHYAIFDEFGTSKQPARPFFRPAVQAAAPRAQQLMVERIASIIEDAQ